MSAKRIIYNVKVCTVNRNRDMTEAVVIEDGRTSYKA